MSEGGWSLQGKLWPQEGEAGPGHSRGEGLGHAARAGQRLLPPHGSPRACLSACLSSRIVSRNILTMAPPGRGQQQGRPASPHSGPWPPGSQPSPWEQDPWGSGGRYPGEAKAETKHMGRGLDGPGRGSASQHQSWGPRAPGARARPWAFSEQLLIGKNKSIGVAWPSKWKVHWKVERQR